jgi:hypothetical protein
MLIRGRPLWTTFLIAVDGSFVHAELSLKFNSQTAINTPENRGDKDLWDIMLL